MQTPLQCGHTRLHEGCQHCLALQSLWYTVLKAQGFEDAENTHNPKRPLKIWSGISIQVTPKGCDELVDVIDLVAYQEPSAPMESSFPDSQAASQERFLHHPGFDALCEEICSHGNHKLTAWKAKEIWQAYAEGSSNRSIATALGINDTLVWRTINTLTQWMELMDLDETQDAPLAKVVLRDYRPRKMDGDEGFVYGTWRNALWFDNEERREGESDRFFREATQTIRTILKSPATRVRVACLDDSDILIVGYSVITGDLLHFVYVKPDYRNKSRQ